jgi:iron complex outermembrane recepter protein
MKHMSSRHSSVADHAAGLDARAKIAALGTTAMVSVLLSAGSAAAQQASSSTSQAQAASVGTPLTVQEVVVTASKRKERLQDAPQTINVVQGDQLQKLNLFNLQDIQQLTPGLNLDNPDGRTQAASIRGVRFDPDTGTQPSVAIYLNQIPVQATDAFQAQYDLAQIETVRGPQGTVQGQPSPSGAILISTQRPSFAGYDGYIDLTGGTRDTQNYQGAFGGPITDTLAFRIAGLYDRSDDEGSKDIVSGISDRHIARSIRGTLEWKPVPNIDVLLMHQEFKSTTTALRDVEGTGAFGTITSGQQEAVSDGTNGFSDKSSITSLTATVDIPGHRISYVGGYQQTHFITQRDLDIGNFLPGYEEYQGIDVGLNRITNEIRFERTGQHFWIYRVGAFFENDTTNAGLDIDYTGGNGACGGFLAALGLPCERSSYSQPSRSRGIFTDHVLNFTPHDVVELGVRYSANYTGPNLGDPNSVSVNSHAPTGMASYKHYFDRNIMAYFTYGRGFRPGGINITDQESNSTPLPRSVYQYKDETSNSYELGTKLGFLRNRIQIDADVFYQTFDNFINRVDNIACTGNPFSGVGPVPGTVYATNTGGVPSATNPVACNGGALNLTYNGPASSRGGEIDARFILTSRWSAQLTASYADAHYDNAQIPCNDYLGTGAPNQVGVPAVQAGQYYSLCKSSAELGLPKFSIDANSEYAVPVAQFEAFVRGLVSYRTSAVNPATSIKIPDYEILNLYTGLRSPSQHWELSFFARNLLNRTVAYNAGQTTSLFTGQPTGYDVVQYASVGRVVGASLRYTFGK